MAEIEINDLHSLGLIRDLKAYQLEPEALSYAENVRYDKRGVEALTGRTQIFGTPGVAPHFALPFLTATQIFWLYTSLTKAYYWDGASHTNITRQTGGVDVNYTAEDTRDWNGFLFGGVPILNNGVDLPQFWNGSGKLDNLTNFPTDLRAKVMRSFGPYMFAINLTDNGTSYPHAIQWSSPSDPGTIPSSWDYTDTTVEAGRKDFADVDAGVLLDGLPLNGRFYLYKDNSVHRVMHVGEDFIFDFKPFLETVGLLAPRCLAITGDGKRHVFVSSDDIIAHNGTDSMSLLTDRMRTTVFSAMDSQYFRNSFLFCNPLKDEMWFCYPEAGSEYPTRAVVWNYRTGGLSEATVNFRNAAVGITEASVGDTWTTASGTWATETQPWSDATRRKVILCDPANTQFLEKDTGTTFDGEVITATIRRENLGVVGRKRNGDWIVDFSKMKVIHRLWIKAEGAAFNVKVGFAETPTGVTSWSAAQSFNPETDLYLDFEGTGRAFAVEFTGTEWFRVEGYKLIGDVGGSF